jgi:hypothetical protein
MDDFNEDNLERKKENVWSSFIEITSEVSQGSKISQKKYKMKLNYM